MNLECGSFIAGQWAPVERSKSFPSVDPATNEVLGHVSDCAEPEIAAAIEAAAEAFQGHWPHDPRLRQNVLSAWADMLSTDAGELARLLTLENGKPLTDATAEIHAAISQIRYYAGLARHIPGHVMEVAPGEFATVLREPAGVVGIITPWNAPVALLVRSLAPALAAGCTCIVKCAPQTALVTAQLVQRLARADGLPGGVVNLVSECGSICAQALVASPEVDVISFTGSTEIGQRIMADAASTVKKLSLELGGKASCIVFPDIDIDATASALVRAGTILSGQQCTAARRVMVHESCFDEMKAALVKAAAKLKIGHGLDPQSQMGPLIDRPTRDRVHESIQHAIDTCDDVLFQGGLPADADLASGAFLAPSLIAHADSTAVFCQAEIFGPLIVVQRFSTEKEAVMRANDTVYGLANSVWTGDGARAMRIARALRSGTVWLNSHGKFSAEAETGGYRRSGLGRLQGYDALADFTELKNVYQAVGTVELSTTGSP